MQLVKWIATGVLVLPLAEIVAFVVVASQIGFAKALILVLLISFFGVLVLRHAGAGQVTRPRQPPPGTIDLSPDEWQSLPDPDAPRRRRRTKQE
jgi:FxsA cytoplasmic membrane protein